MPIAADTGTHWVPIFYLVPHQVPNHLPFANISLTNLSSTPLHHEIQLRFILPKLIFILLESLACPKMNIAIYCRLHENMGFGIESHRGGHRRGRGS